MNPVKFVVVGASLGGLAAVRTLLAGLAQRLWSGDRPSCSTAVPTPTAAWPSCWRPPASLPVLEPEDKEAVCPGHVYLAPANYHLMVDAGVFWLSVDAPVSFARPSIDVLFESVADSLRARPWWRWC